MKSFKQYLKEDIEEKRKLAKKEYDSAMKAWNKCQSPENWDSIVKSRLKYMQLFESKILTEYRHSWPAKYANQKTKEEKTFKNSLSYNSFINKLPKGEKYDWYYVPDESDIPNIEAEKAKNQQRRENLKTVTNWLGDITTSFAKGMIDELYGPSSELSTMIDKIKNSGDAIYALKLWEIRNQKLDKLMNQYKDNKEKYNQLKEIKDRELELKQRIIQKQNDLKNK